MPNSTVVFRTVVNLVRRLALTLFLYPAVSAASSDTLSARGTAIPEDFPSFNIINHPDESLALRDFFYQHYGPAPKATLWDEWLLPPSLWPATRADEAATAWRDTLLERHIDLDGYVATHQHGSIAHQRGWPFPFWNQSAKSFGWHFSFHKTVGPTWRPNSIATPEDWKTTGTESLGLQEEGWTLRLTTADALISPPPFTSNSHEAPFVQIRWRAEGLPATATPYLEWTTDAAPDFAAERRFYFDPPTNGAVEYTMVPVYRHPKWRGVITSLRFGIDNPTSGGLVTIQALFAQYDTRHNVNNPSFVSACIDYFYWTGDLNFLRDNIERIRLAMRFMETEFGTDKDGIVTVPWVGHEGLTGVLRDHNGKPKPQGGMGIGNNYWDLLPFGRQDSYATIRHYGAALKMAAIEEEVAKNPGWNIAPSPLARSADHWRRQAAMGKENGNLLFWNDVTGRFTLGIDSAGGQADFGYTFVNLEAIYYGFATSDHAMSILDWISGKREVADDTSQTTDIYHWRFAPRASTRRNISHYGWYWHGADSIPFGNQVQDGGAVLGFSYHDIMARLKTYGPNDAAKRLDTILEWYREVMAEGGYREYYDGETHEGTLQGGGPPGGLGMDNEFFESVMVPHVMLEGFLGFSPTANGIALKPNLPMAWPSLSINNIQVRGHTVSIIATSQTLTVLGLSKKPGLGHLNVSVEDEWHLQEANASEVKAVDDKVSSTRVWTRTR